MKPDKLRIGITHGDINGIGYEVILKSLTDKRILNMFIPIIYGSSKIVGYYKNPLDLRAINPNVINSAEQAVTRRINLINCVDDDIKVEIGQSTPEAGQAALASLERATEDLKKGSIHALVTAPINKNNIQSDTFNFPGHTEYLEEKFGENSSALMMLVSDRIRIAVVTGHVPINKVSEKITEELIVNKLTILNESLKKDFTIIRPRIAVLGLNPHAGDGGIIGDEEQRVILPALRKAEEKGIMCFGPYPADGFFGAESYRKFDAVLAMYHDQGLIPFKTISMETGVNFTAGLPIIRTSPDHGTAYDLAGKNLASEISFQQALYLACDVYKNRQLNEEISANPLPITEDKKN
ncbi:MAG: 4-hydroxythreonine-4-phosphate dehydrogenase PdxA [Bacteroidales bacterium]|nr:4-hydroxythreonine-4-phosphate dehydrogenase PdxA [Bacteroidales bacterium]